MNNIKKNLEHFEKIIFFYKVLNKTYKMNLMNVYLKEELLKTEQKVIEKHYKPLQKELKFNDFELNNLNQFKKFRKVYANYKTYHKKNKIYCETCNKYYDTNFYKNYHLMSKIHLKHIENME